MSLKIPHLSWEGCPFIALSNVSHKTQKDHIWRYYSQTTETCVINGGNGAGDVPDGSGISPINHPHTLFVEWDNRKGYRTCSRKWGSVAEEFSMEFLGATKPYNIQTIIGC